MRGRIFKPKLKAAKLTTFLQIYQDPHCQVFVSPRMCGHRKALYVREKICDKELEVESFKGI